jgi:hypothetical protein
MSESKVVPSWQFNLARDLYESCVRLGKTSEPELVVDVAQRHPDVPVAMVRLMAQDVWAIFFKPFYPDEITTNAGVPEQEKGAALRFLSTSYGRPDELMAAGAASDELLASLGKRLPKVTR